ncbi:hypothetical protein KW462_12045 [Vibrio fluvialis]|nr:hypothetical protein [Vibrio fluvialis]
MSKLQDKILKHLQSSDTTKAKVIPRMDDYQTFIKVERMILTGIDNLDVPASLIELLGLTDKVSEDGFLDESTILNRLKELKQQYA